MKHVHTLILCTWIIGNVYNIPVQLWLLDSHPYDPPMVYVRPTSTMNIRAGRYVDMNGKVDMPFLQQWKWVSTTPMIYWLKYFSYFFSLILTFLWTPAAFNWRANVQKSVTQNKLMLLQKKLADWNVSHSH